MKYADSHVPSAAIQIVARCSRGGSWFQPKIHTPRNVASSINADRPSIASGAPNRPPTKFASTARATPRGDPPGGPHAADGVRDRAGRQQGERRQHVLGGQLLDAGRAQVPGVE